MQRHSTRRTIGRVAITHRRLPFVLKERFALVGPTHGTIRKRRGAGGESHTPPLEVEVFTCPEKEFEETG